MVYEAEIPEVLNRQQELDMINKLEENFISQPITQWQQNEHLRLNKMELEDQASEMNKNFRKNFAMCFLMFGIASIPFSNMYNRSSSGAPQYFLPKVYFINYREHHIHFYRQLKSMRLIIPSVVILSLLYAERYTDKSHFLDENYETRKAKLPY